MTHHPASFLLAIGLAASLVACQRRESATSDNPPVSTPAESGSMATSSPASTPYDLQFMDTISRHHRMAIDMGKMAQGKFAHGELAATAKKMVEDQEKEIAQMKHWRDQWFPGAANAESMEMPGMSAMKMDMSHLQTLSGNELDLMFIDMMIPHHQGAIEMSRDALAKAERQEIKDLAQKVITAQEKEIEQMQQWKSKWGAAK